MKKLLIPLILLALAAFGLYHHFTSPAMVMRRAAQQALDNFSLAVESQDRVKVSAALKSLLNDDAKIHLEVGLYSFVRGSDNVLTQDFDKPTFLTFIDNTLYSLQSYHYKARIQEFTPGADAGTGSVTFSSQELADGISYYAGVAINVRFSADTTCEGTVVFDGKKALLEKADCKMQLNSMPKPGQESKLRDPSVLQQFLTR